MIERETKQVFAVAINDKGEPQCEFADCYRISKFDWCVGKVHTHDAVELFTGKTFTVIDGTILLGFLGFTPLQALAKFEKAAERRLEELDAALDVWRQRYLWVGDMIGNAKEEADLQEGLTTQEGQG